MECYGSPCCSPRDVKLSSALSVGDWPLSAIRDSNSALDSPESPQPVCVSANRKVVIILMIVIHLSQANHHLKPDLFDGNSEGNKSQVAGELHEYYMLGGGAERGSQ